MGSIVDYDKAAFWTPHRVKILKERYEAGVNTNLIGKELGCTKNTVIGKANRRGYVFGCKKQDSLVA